MNKKLVAQWWAVVALSAGVAACGGGGDSTPAPSAAAPTPAAPTPAAPTPAAPAPSQFTVGGNVAGLQGPVVLKNNAGNALQVAANGGYTFSTSLADGAGYSVTADLQPGQTCAVSNATGTIASANVSNATVACAVKTWIPSATPLESNDNPVVLFDAGMDAQGNVVAVFVKSNGTRPVLYAVRGTPSAAGVAPVWGSPVQLDGDGSEFNLPASFFSNNLSVAVSPNGNAHAVWVHTQACTAQTYNPFSNNACKYIYSSRYTASTQVWDTPALLGDTPSNGVLTAGNDTSVRPVAKVNDRGDSAVFYGGWIRTGTVGYDIHPAVGWRAAGEATFQSRRFDDLTTYGNNTTLPFYFTLDGSGGMALAGHQVQTGSTNKDIVAYLGSLSAGFDAQRTTIDQRGVNAEFVGLDAAPSGEIAIAWYQNNGTADLYTYFSATKKSSASAWSVAELAAASSAESDATHLLSTSAGDALLYVNCGIYRWSSASGAWSGFLAMPSTCGWFASGFANFSSNGSYIFVNASDGQWLTYDIATNAKVHSLPPTPAAPDYVLGVSGANASGLFNVNANSAVHGVALLAPNGIGAYLVAADFDTLPTASSPSGDGRTGITNLWGWYLK